MFRIYVLFLEPVDQLEPFEKWYRRHIVHRELERGQYVFLQPQEGFLLDHDALLLVQEFEHDVEGRVHRLLQFGSEQQADDGERR